MGLLLNSIDVSQIRVFQLNHYISMAYYFGVNVYKKYLLHENAHFKIMI